MRYTFSSVLLAAVTATYCAGNNSEGLNHPLAPNEQPQVTLSRLAGSSEPPLTHNSGLSASTRVVIRDAAAWKEMWSRIWTTQPAPPLPNVDFNQEMVIVAALGTRSSGGYSIAIESAYREGGSLHIVIRTEAPGSGCMATMALTAPVDVARVPRSADPVQFHEKDVTRNCG